MMAERGAKLYSPELLALATSLAQFPMDGSFSVKSEQRSRTCGSSLTLGLDLDGNAHVKRIGLLVSACAVGQSSAAILAQAITGRSPGELAAMLADVERWLTGEGELPEWPGFAALEPARGHSARHGALLLPWKAAHEALSTLEASG